MSSDWMKTYVETFVRLMKEKAGYRIESVKLHGSEEGKLSDIWTNETTAYLVNVTFKHVWHPPMLDVPDKVTVCFYCDAVNHDELIADWTFKKGKLDVVDLVKKLTDCEMYMNKWAETAIETQNYLDNL